MLLHAVIDRPTPLELKPKPAILLHHFRRSLQLQANVFQIQTNKNKQNKKNNYSKFKKTNKKGLNTQDDINYLSENLLTELKVPPN